MYIGRLKYTVKKNFKLYLSQGFSANSPKNLAVHFKGVRRTLMRIWSFKGLLSK
jgi:hypothetical protein